MRRVATVHPNAAHCSSAVHHRCAPTNGGQSVVNAAIKSAEIHLSAEITELQSQLWENVTYFDSLVDSERVINRNLLIPIRGLLIGNEEKAILCAKTLREKGFFVLTAMYPTVAKGKSMLRFAFASDHKKEEIFKFCNIINEFKLNS